MTRILLVIIGYFLLSAVTAQERKWTKEGNAFYQVQENEIAKYTLPALTKTVAIPATTLQAAVTAAPFKGSSISFTSDENQFLLFTNTQKVWRYETRGDYWVFNKLKGSLKQLGKTLPSATLMFAKFSPDAKKVAYVSNYNLYVEDLETAAITQLTFDGNRKLINGTFDWAYEEEFFCRDGFRWSPDSRQIAFWQIDASTVKDHIMINNTDSIYPIVIPVEYPVSGEAPSPFKIGIIDIASPKTRWMNISSDPVLKSYAPRMEWANNSTELIVQHLSRRQNKSDLLLCNAADGSVRTIYTETDSAWIDILPLWDEDYANGGWDWLKNGQAFLWASEKDGWRHLYSISRDGKSETLLTRGNYDVMEIGAIDEKNGFVYFFASPDNATQKYLYRAKLDGSGSAERLSPTNQAGTHNYEISPVGTYAYHSFSNYQTPTAREWITLPAHKPLSGNPVNDALAKAKPAGNLEFFKVKTTEGIEMDAWMVKPDNFNPAKKYPVLFYVYTEPWGQLVKDIYGMGGNFLYQGSLARDGYIYIAVDNRGTPVPKGRSWRKSVFKNIGVVNIRDQAMAAREIMKMPFVDTSRIAVWGWSGGGSATLNLMFQYPDIYKTGIAIAAVANQLTYDNIYQERYMGLPQESKADFVKGSPLTYAKNLRGNLLYIHGTGDDNVHYNNAEMLVNELIKYNKHFQFMPYPNRTHSISEGEGTQRHLSTLFTEFLKKNCPPGGR